ncbi:diacylglycerol kinase family protein [Staphylococcus capitis]|uniref:diacylglycerol kinase family protein n=1 Tax=Staphylococcus capitis TaxID=29388 RepID=UPI00345C46FC
MRRFKYAYDGFTAILKKDQNFLLHILAGIIAIIMGFIFHINRSEWMFILFSIALVLSLEAINTSIEFVVDLVTTDYHEYAKHAKDIAAFSVVIVSVLALCVGLIVFVPHILSLFLGGK